MTDRPGRETRRVEYRARRTSYFVSRCIDQLLFLTVVTLFAVATLGHLQPTPLLTCWLATLIALALLQAKLARDIVTCNLEPQAVAGRAEVMLVCLVISGIVWGLMGLYTATRGGTSEQVLVVVFIAGLIIYAVTHASAIFGAFTLYVLALSAPTMVTLTLLPDLLTRILGAALVVITAAGLIGGWRHYKLLCHTVRLEVEVGELDGVLNQLSARLNQTNDKD